MSGNLMMAWRLEGREVLVVGGGRVAAGRVQLALDADARVTVVAPRLGATLSGEDRIRWVQRCFVPSDLDSVDLVMTAIDDEAASHAIVEQCRAQRIPVNAADLPALCDFWLPSVFQDGPVQVAVSTHGQGPALARRIRQALTAALPRDVGQATLRFGALRRAIRAADPAPEHRDRRMAWLTELASTGAWSAFARWTDADITALVATYLHPVPTEWRSTSADPVHGTVTLVGAGPGDPAWLTLAARDAIDGADLVIADRLVSPEILDTIRVPMRIARKFPGRADAAQAELEAWIMAAVRRGERVVRLKCGDPFVFGRGGEEVARLSAQGVTVAVIPGISSALAAPLVAGVPVTERGIADRVLVLTGQGQGGRMPELPTYQPGQTLVLLMAVQRIDRIVAGLTAQGFPGDLPVAVIERASWPSQRVMHSRLRDLPEDMADAEIAAPATLVVGLVATRIDSSACIAAEAI